MSASNVTVLRPGQHPDIQKFPKNAWYIAAGSAEIGNKPFARTINDEPLAIFRQADGVPIAVHDACPHKGFPLSKGVVIGNDIRCGYHGISFNGSGQCTKVPSQSSIPSAMRVRSYPVVERGLFIWVWTGEPGKAASTPLPVLGFEDIQAVQREFFFAVEIACNAQFLIDNLFDHTHFAYLHQGSLDTDPDKDGGDLMKAPLQFTQEGDSMSTWRSIDSIEATKDMAVIWGVPEGNTYRRRIETKGVPANGYMGSLDCFRDIDNPETIVAQSAALGCVTPIDDDHCLHIVTWTTSYPQHAQMKEIVRTVVDQDVVVLPDIHAFFKSNPQAGEVSIQGDKAAMISRRMVQEAYKRLG